MLLNVSGILRIHTKEMKYLPSGSAILKMNCVSSEKYKNQSGETVDNSCWIEVTAFSKTAENINKFFNEKDRIYVIGKLNQDTWTDNQGAKKSKHSIKLESFEFIEKNDNQSQQNQGSYQSNSQNNSRVERVEVVPEYDIDDDNIPF